MLPGVANGQAGMPGGAARTGRGGAAQPEGPAARGGAARGRITDRDLEIVRWLARMRFAAGAQIARAFGMSPRMVYRRCHLLCAAGCCRHERVLADAPGVYLATASGCGLAQSPLSAGPARVDLLNFRHDLALVSLSLDLLSTPGARWRSERELRQAMTGRDGVGRAVHVPDGVLLGPDGGRTAIELDLTPKTSRRLSTILRFYSRSRDYDAVRYFLPSRAAAARLAALAEHLPFVAVEHWEVPAAGQTH
jgi:hypothetical protein